MLLVDTNIVSYFYRRDDRAKSYEGHLVDKMLFISFMTVAELYKWPFMKWTMQKPEKVLALAETAGKRSAAANWKSKWLRIG